MFLFSIYFELKRSCPIIMCIFAKNHHVLPDLFKMIVIIIYIILVLLMLIYYNFYLMHYIYQKWIEVKIPLILK